MEYVNVPSQLKEKILARLGVTMVAWDQKYSTWKYQERRPLRAQLFELIHLTSMSAMQRISWKPTLLTRNCPQTFRHRWASKTPTIYDKMVVLVECS